MFLLRGKKTARIKSFTDNHERCKKCGAFDISVAVYREYYHFYFIPFLPIGPKDAKSWCSSRGEPFGSPALQKQYEDSAKTPFYFYSIPILIAALVVVAIFANISNQNEKAAFVRNPKAGDVYLMRSDQKDTVSYYFFKVSTVKGDTVFVYHNNGVYTTFTTSLASNDSFNTEEELMFTKQKLQQMLDSGAINAVMRN